MLTARSDRRGYGAVGPAMASTSHDSTSSESSNSATSLWSANSLHSLNDALDNIGNGGNGATLGNVSNESPVVVAPQVGDVVSGNAVASGNDTPIANGSGNGTSASSSVGDLVDVTGIIDGVTQSVDLGSILGR